MSNFGLALIPTMSRKIVSTLATAVVLILASCNNSDSSGDTFKPSVTGRNGEILVVINDNIKTDTVGRYIAAMFGETYLGLPTAEPLFDMSTVPHGYFDKMMHTFRNIMVVEVSDTVTCDTLQCFNDVWAKPQAVVIARAKSKAALLDVVRRNHIKTISFISRAERERLLAFNRTIKHIPLSEQIGNRHNIEITIPNTFEKCNPRNQKAMSWAYIDQKDSQVGLFVYEFPYVGEGTLSKEFLLNKRDSLLRSNIEGPDGSYMCTEIRFGLDEIIYKSGTYKGNDVAELRGLWRMEGYMMGGPFLLRAIYDKPNNRVVVTDGYVYYPSRERKRNLIRQLEAVMYSVSLNSEKQTP